MGYGLIQLGANVTLVDINKSAIQEAQNNIRELGAEVDAVVTPMERVHEALKAKSSIWSGAYYIIAKIFLRLSTHCKP